ncbi:glycosyltransferase family 4 protein [Arthrobacter sp. 24S4-2]|uniref:glycosyltransferase family 4 protein n=1 Tax=Arthrobacter sp. 24S4-2 TaxID=2575374 RepID=UPI0010C7A8C1|nr:glycosyltransferase family 4 protein [Arthrobacter sp. 24S4-2]QCO96997.1 glycosyltransferase family 4 protein [Arthrobacter sp. 24S4-2]
MPGFRTDRPSVRLLVPGNVRHNSGGNAYNAALARGLTVLGTDVAVCLVDGHWPVGSGEERRRLAGLLPDGDSNGDVDSAAGGTSDGTVAGPVTIVDGLVALGAPQELEAAAAAGRPAWILLHMPLDAHPDLEERALAAAAGVICTSSTTAAAIGARRCPAPIHVALPGTDSAPPAAGSDPPHLVAVAALLPNKDQLLLLEAFAGLTDLTWTAALVGSDSADPAYARAVRSAIGRLGLTGRVTVHGELSGAALNDAWHRADLSLLISQAEAYGMVVTESLARGIPVVVRDGTGAVEALAAGSPGVAAAPEGVAGPALPGTAVVLGADPSPLEGVLRGWLTDPDLRAQWRGAALAARNRLPGWDVTARTVLDAIAGDGPGNRTAPAHSVAVRADGQWPL